MGFDKMYSITLYQFNLDAALSKPLLATYLCSSVKDSSSRYISSCYFFEFVRVNWTQINNLFL